MQLEKISSFSLMLHKMQGNCCLSEAKRDEFMQMSLTIKANQANALSLSQASQSPTTSGCFLSLCCLRPQQQLAQLQKEKSEILKNLALYYFTFVDVMEFKVGKHTYTHKYTQNHVMSTKVKLSTLVATGPRVWAAEHHRRLPGFLRHCESITGFHFDTSAPNFMSLPLTASQCHPVSLSDGELWPHQELPGLGGDLHDPDDHLVPHRGEEGHHRPVQLRPRDDARSQVSHEAADTLSCRSSWLDQALMRFLLLCSDREYPRLGQMIVDYENPLKKMMEEFVPHGKVENQFLTFTDTLTHLWKWIQRFWLVNL